MRRVLALLLLSAAIAVADPLIGTIRLEPPIPPAGEVWCWGQHHATCCRAGAPIACVRFMGPNKTPHYKRLS